MGNKFLTSEEFSDNITKSYANIEYMQIEASDECFERMKKFMTQDKIDKAMILRNEKRSKLLRDTVNV